MTRERQLRLLIALLVALCALWAYRILAPEAPQTRPLAYTRGMKVTAPVRTGVAAAGAEQDPLSRFLARRVEQYPGVTRDIFRTQGAGAGNRGKSAIATKPAVSAVSSLTPTVRERSPEEAAQDKARADLQSFRFYGYVDTDKGTSLFLSKDGELFIARSGDRLLQNYRIKEAGKDHVLLQDMVTKVEVRVELSGGGEVKGR